MVAGRSGANNKKVSQFTFPSHGKKHGKGQSGAFAIWYICGCPSSHSELAKAGCEDGPLGDKSACEERGRDEDRSALSLCLGRRQSTTRWPRSPRLRQQVKKGSRTSVLDSGNNNSSTSRSSNKRVTATADTMGGRSTGMGRKGTARAASAPTPAALGASEAGGRRRRRREREVQRTIPCCHRPTLDRRRAGCRRGNSSTGLCSR